jgi:hypothetical protein
MPPKKPSATGAGTL